MLPERRGSRSTVGGSELGWSPVEHGGRGKYLRVAVEACSLSTAERHQIFHRLMVQTWLIKKAEYKHLT